MQPGNFGVLFLSAAFCIAGLFLLSSCDDDEAEPVEMRGFFLSIDETATVDCGYEDADVYLEGDESTGRLDVKIISTSPTFPDSKFTYKGTKIIKSKGNEAEETIAASYLFESGGENHSVGTLYIVSRTDDEIGNGATIFAGHWRGKAIRLEENPIVMCPYVLVPREALDGDSCGAEVTQMAPGLRKYLADNADNPTRLGYCYSLPRRLT
ncbi:MAG: hypothetical protein OXH71_05380 [Candidatus Dadabacteria bacterium]|nr:hypothetical protein [Candidatus Dadabacteria bacterium]MDE0520108.1 hypothetical protein [Candidatus Dadabacteria bacterium]MDE0662351.1 hypothetical protein [Candidatus Dadabacteria bacterium]